MAIRWSRWSPRLALSAGDPRDLGRFRRIDRLDHLDVADAQPALRRLRHQLGRMGAPVSSACSRTTSSSTALKNMVVLGIGSLLAIVFGFILAAMIDREKRGEGIFRTVFLYPLAVSLIVTGLAWRWLFNPTLGVQEFLHQIGLPWARFDWLNYPETAMYGIILGTVWQGSGFYMALMLVGPQIHQHGDLERCASRRRQLLAPLRRDHHPDDEIHLPDLRHPALARRGEGLRHGLRHDQRRPGAIDLGAGLLHDQRLLAEAESGPGVRGRGRHARPSRSPSSFPWFCSQRGSSGGRRRGCNEFSSPTPRCATNHPTTSPSPSRAGRDGSGDGRSPSSPFSPSARCSSACRST